MRRMLLLLVLLAVAPAAARAQDANALVAVFRSDHDKRS